MAPMDFLHQIYKKADLIEKEDDLHNNPILDIAARFWEKDRYNAFKILYRPMRIIDDFIDNHKSADNGISESEKKHFTVMINDWVKSLYSANSDKAAYLNLVGTITRFQIPLWPWRSFSESMIYDIHHTGFRTFSIFLRYAEGAVVAPAAIVAHMCGLVKENGHYSAPRFDIRRVARPAALFCYLVHIIRDFQKDQNKKLIYFAESLLAKNGLNSRMLGEIACKGKISPGFRNLMGEYYTLAEHYRRKTRQSIDNIGDFLEPQYRLSIEIIYGLYMQIFERINVNKGRFTTEELNPSTKEIKDRISQIISAFE
jgi:phytoene synthase